MPSYKHEREPENSRLVGDIRATRQRIFDTVLDTVAQTPPLSNPRHTLTLSNVAYSGPEDFSLKEQKQAILGRQTLGRKLRGVWNLKSPDGTLLKRKATLATVPYMTPRGTFIINGTEYTISSQQRLLPGIFTRQRESGELESHINVAKGYGHRYSLDPASKKFKIRIGQANIPLLPVLKAIGARDKDIQEAWGRDVYAANVEKNPAKALKTIYTKLYRDRPTSPETTVESIRKAFEEMTVDPDVTHITLGKPYTHVNAETVLAATKKLIDVYKGEAQPDDRDAMNFQRIMGPEDIFAERFKKSPNIARQILWKATAGNSLDKVPTGALDELVQGVIFDSGLANPLAEINNIELLDHQYRITRMGSGGIESINAIPYESRMVQPTQMGFLDPVTTPECSDSFTEVMTEAGWKFWPEVTEEDKLACLINNKLEFCHPYKLVSYDYNGELYGYSGDVSQYLVTPEHRLYISDGPSYSDSDTEAFNWKFITAKELHESNKDYFVLLEDGVKYYCKPEYNYTINYNGKVYCATVPGGLLLIKHKSEIGHWSGNSLRVGVESRISINTRKGADGKIYSRFINAKTGKPTWVSPQTAVDAVLAFPGSLASGEDYVIAIKGGKEQYVPREEVDYELANMDEAFGPMASLIPLKANSFPQRVSMGSRFLSQALPLINAEAPLVQNKPHDGDQSFSEIYSEWMGAARSPISGVISDIRQGEVEIRDADGQKHIVELYDNLPYARATFIHNTPVVTVGQSIKAGDLVARSNFTDDKGITALGLNARVAYLPVAENYEDAFVVSESFARRATSEHAYTSALELGEGIKPNKNAFISIFPNKFDADVLKRYNADGTIKPGETVNKGEPLILAVKEKKSDRPGTRKMSWADASVLWEHDNPGTVTDVHTGRDSIDVMVKATAAMDTADKLCYDEKTEVLTSLGWKPVSEITLDDEICTLPDGENIVYQKPVAVHKYETGGKMYKLSSQLLDFCVTENHNMYVKSRFGKKFELRPAIEIAGREFSYKKDGNWEGKSPEFIVIPGITVKAGQGGVTTRDIPELRIPTSQFMMLLGCYLSEGCCFAHVKSGSYGIDISQIKQPGKQQLINKLLEYDIKFNDHISGIRIYSKQLMEYFKQFGKAKAKYIPDEFFSYSKEDLKILFNWLMWGDGHTKDGKPICYTTTSPQLADDVQRLCLHIGYAANIKTKHIKKQKIKNKWYDCARRYDVRIITTKLTPTVNHSHVKTQKAQKEYFIINYDKPVYCVTVPGSVLYVRRNYKPAWSGNSGLYGNKGIVVVKPDNEMPHDKDGNPIEVLTSPMGIISRGNVSQIWTTLLGKIAKARGEPYKLEDFSDKDMQAFVKRELERHNITSTEDLVDPKTGKTIPGVLTGYDYMLKLYHTAESKLQERGEAGAYTSEDIPGKGGAGGSAKRLGLLDVHALLSSGAYATVRDAGMIRGQKNEDYWRQFMAGYTPPEPTVPFIWEKFVNQLTAAGIHPIKKANRFQVLALTNDDIKELAANRVIENSETIDWRHHKLKPISGGLFDETKTGGLDGNRFSKIKIEEPMPNPVMVEPIRRILKMTEQEFEDVLLGRKQLYSDDDKVSKKSQTGPLAIKHALENINLDREIQYARAEITGGRKTARDSAIKRLQYLEAAKKYDQHPSKWIWDSVPVLPPKFRPISIMEGGTLLSADANSLYKAVMEANDNLKNLKGKISDVSEERGVLWQSMKSLVGLTDPVQPQLKQQRVKGLLATIIGDSPKAGTMQRKLLGISADVVGRAVIAPNSQLDIDQVGLPIESAWELYRPFIVRRLTRRGMNMLEALRQVKEQTPVAFSAMQQEMEERPVIVNRAPVLHKYGIVAFRPVLTQSKALEVSPNITPPMGGDFDGDHCINQVFTALSKSAIKEISAFYSSNFLESRKMSRFHTTVPVIQDGYELFLFDLEDFPHGELINKKEGQKGPIEFYEAIPGTQVVAYDEKTKQLAWQNVAGYSIHKDREIILVNLRSGRQIITDDDPRAVYGIGHDSLQPARFTPKDAVANNVLVPTVTILPETTEIDAIDTFTSSVVRNIKTHGIKKQLQLNNKSGYALGVMVGDGWCGSNSRQIHVAGLDNDIFGRFHESLSEFFDGDVPEPGFVWSDKEDGNRYGNCGRITYTSVNVGSFINSLIGHKAKNKHLPPFFLSANREFREGLFAGLLDTDGSISIVKAKAKNKPQLQCNYTTISIRLANEVRLLAASLGIRARITAFNYRGDKQAWLLYFSSLDMQKWGGKYMACQYKKDNLVKLEIPEINYAKNDTVPISKALSAKLQTLLSPIQKTSSALTSAYAALSASRGKALNRISRNSALVVIEALGDQDIPEYDEWIAIVNNKTVTWDPVASLEETGVKETGYDLTVPGYETFMSVDGVILSNTMGFHVPVSSDAVQEAYAKLLPSKNLLYAQDFKRPTYMPSQQFLLGLWLASTRKDKKSPVKTFRSAEDVVDAYRSGELKAGQRVRIAN